jgi:hypothetical protein
MLEWNRWLMGLGEAKNDGSLQAGVHRVLYYVLKKARGTEDRELRLEWQEFGYLIPLFVLTRNKFVVGAARMVSIPVWATREARVKPASDRVPSNVMFFEKAGTGDGNQRLPTMACHFPCDVKHCIVCDWSTPVYLPRSGDSAVVNTVFTSCVRFVRLAVVRRWFLETAPSSALRDIGMIPKYVQGKDRDGEVEVRESEDDYQVVIKKAKVEQDSESLENCGSIIQSCESVVVPVCESLPSIVSAKFDAMETRVLGVSRAAKPWELRGMICSLLCALRYAHAQGQANRLVPGDARAPNTTPVEFVREMGASCVWILFDWDSGRAYRKQRALNDYYSVCRFLLPYIHLWRRNGALERDQLLPRIAYELMNSPLERLESESFGELVLALSSELPRPSGFDPPKWAKSAPQRAAPVSASQRPR